MPKYYAVYPCQKWLDEYVYRHSKETSVIYWYSLRYARQSAFDTGGFIVPFHSDPPPQTKIQIF